jgi:hypothetical protein
MASDITTKVDFQLMHLVPDVVLVSKTTQYDTISFTKYPGVLVLNAQVFTIANNATTNVTETITYGVGKVNNTGTAYTATSTSIVYDGAAATRIAPYFIMTASGEIIKVIADSGKATTGGTMTVQRGCYGTTASATGLADNDPIYFMNQLLLGSTSVGLVTMLIFPLPQDAGVPLFKAQNSS